MTKLRNVKILQSLFLWRDNFMTRYGLFETKKNFKRWAYFKWAKVEDTLHRWQIAKQIRKLPTNMLTSTVESPNIIVSMTSYGKRVKSSAAYALYSILTQKQLPNHIILNLDREKWNNENIPKLLKHLQKVGVEVNFCEDVGPHTKLLPTLSKYPNDIIITADDDIYYDSTLVSELYDGYCGSDKKSIICRLGIAICQEQNKILPYSQCPMLGELHQYVEVSKMPFGVAGVLYPPHIFSSEVFNARVFRKICRLADDVWFGVIELKEKVPVIYLHPNSWNKCRPVDRAISYSKDSEQNLTFFNDYNGANDIQFRTLLDYFNLD